MIGKRSWWSICVESVLEMWTCTKSFRKGEFEKEENLGELVPSLLSLESGLSPSQKWSHSACPRMGPWKWKWHMLKWKWHLLKSNWHLLNWKWHLWKWKWHLWKWKLSRSACPRTGPASKTPICWTLISSHLWWLRLLEKDTGRPPLKQEAPRLWNTFLISCRSPDRFYKCFVLFDVLSFTIYIE